MLAQAAVLLSALTAPINSQSQAYTRPHHGRWSWSAAEITLGGMFVATLWVDRRQTCAASAAGVRESSPIIGPHPSAGQIDTYTVLYSLATLGTAAVAPRGGWRVGLLAFNLGGEAAAIQAHVPWASPYAADRVTKLAPEGDLTSRAWIPIDYRCFGRCVKQCAAVSALEARGPSLGVGGRL